MSRLKLFCFPHAGGGARTFYPWQAPLAPLAEVRPVELPGHGARLREEPFTLLSPLVESTYRELLPELRGPFAFFGHSMGALIAFELARLLRREQGLEPAHLLVSGSRAPQVPDLRPPTYALPDDEFIAELRRLEGTPREVLEQPELIALMVPLLRADFSVADRYEYSPGMPLSCPITALGGLQDRETPRESLEAWREQTSAEFTVNMLPGDHFFLLKDQPLVLQSIAQALRPAAVGHRRGT